MRGTLSGGGLTSHDFQIRNKVIEISSLVLSSKDAKKRAKVFSWAIKPVDSVGEERRVD